LISATSWRPLEAAVTRRVDRRLLAGLVLLAVLLKAAFLWLLLPDLLGDRSVNFAMFPDGYDLIAANIAEGHGYRMYADLSPTMIRTPGYVLVLAALFYVFGKSILAAQVLNFLFSGAAALLVFDTGRRVLRSERVAAIAAFIVVLHPIVLVSDSRGGPESLMLLCVAALVWTSERLQRGLAGKDFVLLGLIHGFGMLVKSSMALLLPAVVVWLVARHWRSREAVIKIAVGTLLAGALSVAVQSPWIARNFMISGQFVPTMTVGGVAAFQGQHVVAHRDEGREHGELLDEAADRQVLLARTMGLEARGYYFQQFSSVADELRFYAELTASTWARYREEPWLLARAVAYNAVAFWVQGRTGSSTRDNAIVVVPLLVLAAWGSVVHRRRPEVQLGWLLLAAYIAPHLVYMSIARYQAPVIPIIALLAAAVLVRPKSTVVSSR
jgi:4-amino-4-deoxy-L-arabinose transferase-like glycosyltransferase